MGAWLVITLVVLIHNILKWPTYCSYSLSLLYISSKILLSLSTSSRKCLSFWSNAWKVIFQLLMMLSHSDFLLKSQEFLIRNSGVRANDLVSILIYLWNLHLYLLGHSQNLIVFSWWWLKKILRSLRMRATYFCKGWDNVSNIFLAMWIELVTTMILEIF